MLKKFSKIGALGLVGIFAIAGAAGCADNKATDEVDEEVVVTEEIPQSEVDGAQSGVDVAFVIDNNLVGEYQLASIEVEGVSKTVEDFGLTDPVILTIEANGTVTGKVCNNFGTAITEDGVVGEGFSTMMYCEEPAELMNVENLVLGTMGGTVNIEGAEVTFIGTNGDQSFWTVIE